MSIAYYRRASAVKSPVAERHSDRRRLWCATLSQRSFNLLRIPLIGFFAIALPSCAMQGDFGRAKTYTLLGYPLDAAYWASSATHVTRPSKYALTPEEKALREASYRFRIQIHNLTPVKVAYRPENAYAGHLTAEKHSYGPSRVSLIDHELRSDHQALNVFADAARRVLYADQQRMHAILETQSYLTLGDRRQARRRMRENYAVIEGTFIDLEQRIAAYDQAIDKTRLETPNVSVAELEGGLNHLRDRIASLHYELQQSYQAGDNYAHRRRYDENPFKRPLRRGRQADEPLPQSDPQPTDIRPFK